LCAVLEFLDRLYVRLDSWIDEHWDPYFAPPSENLEAAISRLTGDLSTVLSDILGQMAAIGFVALEDLVTQSRDWMGMFSLGLNKGYDNQDFLWSDMLHYRNTSKFGQRLWREATSEKQKAYALGYMTHLAADVAGHPFVNEKTGGPFRTHWQRHHVVENHMEAKVYDDDHGAESYYKMLAESALYYRISFEGDGVEEPSRPESYPQGQSLRDRYERRCLLDINSELPPEVADLIVRAMESAYSAAERPQILEGGLPNGGQVWCAYDLQFRYLKHTMMDGFSFEKPQPPELFPNLDFPVLTNPFDPPPGESDGHWSFWDWVLAIVRFICWIEAIAFWLGTILLAIVLDVATYLSRLLLYYTVQLPLYEILKAQRAIMVRTGYLLPMQDEILPELVRLGFGTGDAFRALLEDMGDVRGGYEESGELISAVERLVRDGVPASEAVARVLGDFRMVSAASTEPLPDPMYPRSHPLDAEGCPIEYHAPWRYPNTPVELDAVFAGPYVRGEMPHVLVEDGTPGSQTLRGLLENAPSPEATDDLASSQVTRTNNLGDPVNLAVYLVWQLTRSNPPNDERSRVADWNLDGDRGYAYKCWDWDRHQAPSAGVPHDPAHHVLRDAEGREYLEPCTPPPQSDSPSTYSAGVPLALHYTDEPDPGCP
jgi:hypothetical protein